MILVWTIPILFCFIGVVLLIYGRYMASDFSTYIGSLLITISVFGSLMISVIIYYH